MSITIRIKSRGLHGETFLEAVCVRTDKSNFGFSPILPGEGKRRKEFAE